MRPARNGGEKRLAATATQRTVGEGVAAMPRLFSRHAAGRAGALAEKENAPGPFHKAVFSMSLCQEPFLQKGGI